jgi:hypothetical protein
MRWCVWWFGGWFDFDDVFFSLYLGKCDIQSENPCCPFFFFPDIWFSHLIFYCMIFVLVFFVNFKFLFDFTLNLNVIFSFILSWIHVWSFFFWFWVFILISLARCLISFNFTLNQLMLPPFLFIAFDPHSFILLIVFAFYQKKNFNFIF